MSNPITCKLVTVNGDDIVTVSVVAVPRAGEMIELKDDREFQVENIIWREDGQVVIRCWKLD